MDINVTYKAFLGVSWLYLVTTAFTLAKMLRDRHEADLLEASAGPPARPPAPPPVPNDVRTQRSFP